MKFSLLSQRLISDGHYAADEVGQRRSDLAERRENLTSASSDRRKKLEASYRYQLFERDCDEVKVWISEKLKIANDANYKDPTNLQGTCSVLPSNLLRCFLSGF